MNSPLERVLLVLPALNEEQTIAAVLAEIRRHVPEATCLVVDDGSTDRTAALARAAGALVLELPYNLGVGGAMRAGFKYALANRFDVVVQIDADGQHDPAEVHKLVEQLASADLVLGARFAGEGSYSARGPRRWAMRVLARILSVVTKTTLTDSTSGFRASGPRAIRLFADHYPAEYLGDTIETLVIAARHGCTVRQVPVAMRPRAGGTASHSPLKAATYLARVSIALIFALVRPASTMRVRSN